MNEKHAIAITSHQQAELIKIEDNTPLKKGDVRGRTLASLISPGTELNACYLQEKGFPIFLGYAVVCEIEEIGENVDNIKVGDRVFIPGKHQSSHIFKAKDSILIPASLSSEKAVIARLMQVSMTSLITTKARPGDNIIISGFGPIGFLAAQMYLLSGYNVIVIEPDDARRKLAINLGIQKSFEKMPLSKNVLPEEIALIVECSGHEQAVLDSLKIVRRHGEVIMVGVPWKKQTDISAHEILWEVFHKYVTFRTGWEWELPHHSSPTEPHSLKRNIITALNWLDKNSINLNNVTRIHDPKNPNEAYQGHLNHSQKELFSIFDWTQS